MAGETENRREGGASRRQLTWYLFFRVLFIILFLTGTIIYQLHSGLDRPHPALPYLYLLAGLSCLHALMSAIMLRAVRGLRVFTQAQIAWDLLFATGLIYVTGGIDSLFSLLYLIIIISGGIFMTRREVFFAASASSILYGSLLDLQYYGYLPQLGGLAFPQQVSESDVFYAVFVNVLGFFFTALLTGMLVDRLRRSEQALERRTVDFGELEELNRTILASIGSGLMIVNPRGRVRSFNAAASRITGYTLQEVYDRKVRELFPGMGVYDGGLLPVSRAEVRVKDKHGGLRTLGYAASMVKDPQEQNLGLLVTFQDLTHLKAMEGQLKRADRLAAVGQLASGMAHEIRNPLASISGSVQLLMEDRNVSEENRRLMEIVVREADRLGNLLTDFLVYARPNPPELVEEDVSALLDDLVEMVNADARFTFVDFSREYAPGGRMPVDRRLFRQALLNLLINAAEAMGGRGKVLLGLDPDAGAVYVEDTGPGIPAEIREKIFDPFFTTKDRGTGLGLATVYAVIEAMGGSVELSEGSAGGARFTLQIPRGES
ncbi:ATP-binding protein [Desulfuromonas sp.]|uniref:two-component system sensor histidine kinase NtrB n=1 Tax=Desulfuromonas sp. TaxID=892 RepID=UPI0025C02CF9|nr:ATP-binding protein [Desulfuromonas sp.]